MKIVNFKTFIEMPANTLFSKYDGYGFGDIMIKEKSINDNDFLYYSINDNIDYENSNTCFKVLEDAESTGRSISMDLNTLCRDGCFNDEQLFAVWENKDIEQLIEKLKGCL